jgi:calcium-independent phospholipase A2
MLRSMENIWDAPVVHCFDWISGTSTGAILALALASGKTVPECQALYFRLKDKVRLFINFLLIDLLNSCSFK